MKLCPLTSEKRYFNYFFALTIFSGIAFCQTPSPYCEQRVTSRLNGYEKADQVQTLPGLGHVDGLQLSGYLPVSDKSDEKLFFWFVGSHQDAANDPIVLWLNGGPGSSSFNGFFSSNGPYFIDEKGVLTPRRYSWTAKSGFLIFDQPIGVGMSFRRSKTPLRDEAEAMDHLYFALSTFFKRNPELAKQPLYLAGQSYAGKYLPQLATRILDGKTPMNLKGLLIGDGWVNPLVQQSANADYAHSHGLIDENVSVQIKQLYGQCAQEIQKSTPSSRRANELCMKMQKLIKESSGLGDTTNISPRVEVKYRDHVENYLNRRDVREALHACVDCGGFKLYSEQVWHNLEIGMHDSTAHLYPKLLDAGIRVLIYSGLDDGTDSNFMGTDKWLAALNWRHRDEFNRAATCVWKNSGGEVAGFARTVHLLTYVKIRGAGHIAPMDQPANLQELLHRFISSESYCL